MNDSQYKDYLTEDLMAEYDYMLQKMGTGEPREYTSKLNDTAVIRRHRLLSRKVYLSFVISLLPLTVTVLIQMFVDAFLLLDICMVLFALSMYGLILSDQIEQK